MAADPLGNRPDWLNVLSEQDRMFIKRFVLCSGSLKALAREYDVSYPTIRLRLDRLIAKIEVLDSEDRQSAFERALRAAYAEGKLDEVLFRELLEAHRRTLQGEQR